MRWQNIDYSIKDNFTSILVLPKGLITSQLLIALVLALMLALVTYYQYLLFYVLNILR